MNEIVSFKKYIQVLGEVVFKRENNIWYAILSTEQRNKLASLFEDLMKKIEELRSFFVAFPIRSQLDYIKSQLENAIVGIKIKEKLSKGEFQAYLNMLQGIEKALLEIQTNLLFKIESALRPAIKEILWAISRVLSSFKNICNNILKAFEEASKIPSQLVEKASILINVLPFLIIGGIIGIGWVIYKIVKQPERYEGLLEKAGVLAVKSKTKF